MELDELARRLDAAYRSTAARFPQPGVRIEKIKNKAGLEVDTLILTGLEKVEEPESLQILRHRVARRQPLVDLPELLLEIQARTGFASEFSHVSEGRSRLDDLPISICAVLLAEACNIGLTPMIRAGIPALERDRLLYVQQNYIRPDTLSRTNACLVDYQAQIPLAQAWGGGEVASADGLCFVVPLKTFNAGPNTKYFGTGRGITLVNYTSDQFSGFKNIVVTGTLRDSLVVLEGLLNQETGLNPKELMTDTASYTDLIFGLFHALGYYIDDPAYRRRILIQLNKGESRHSLARVILVPGNWFIHTFRAAIFSYTSSKNCP